SGLGHVCVGVPSDGEEEVLSYEVYSNLKKELWQGIENLYRLLSAQNDLLKAAKREIQFKKPHTFPDEEHAALLNSIRHLFYHIASLYLILEAQDAVLKADSTSDDG